MIYDTRFFIDKDENGNDLRPPIDIKYRRSIPYPKQNMPCPDLWELSAFYRFILSLRSEREKGYKETHMGLTRENWLTIIHEYLEDYRKLSPFEIARLKKEFRKDGYKKCDFGKGYHYTLKYI